jgi:HSP20 family molecular chaperone IbpA
MKKSRLIPIELLQSIDITNTIGGGVSQPIIELKQHEGHREIKCKVPGVAESALQVEVISNFLSIYYTQEFLSRGTSIEIPKVVYHKAIPYFIDIAKISATVEEGVLCVTLPFNKLANGYHKKISVQE